MLTSVEQDDRQAIAVFGTERGIGGRGLVDVDLFELGPELVEERSQIGQGTGAGGTTRPGEQRDRHVASVALRTDYA